MNSDTLRPWSRDLRDRDRSRIVSPSVAVCVTLFIRFLSQARTAKPQNHTTHTSVAHRPGKERASREDLSTLRYDLCPTPHAAYGSVVRYDCGSKALDCGLRCIQTENQAAHPS